MKEWRMHAFLLVKVQVLVRIVVKIGELDKSTTKLFAIFRKLINQLQSPSQNDALPLCPQHIVCFSECDLSNGPGII